MRFLCNLAAVFIGFCLTAAPASAARFSAASLPLVDELAETCGFDALSGVNRDALALGVGIYAIAFGHLTHLVLAENGFGRIANALLGIFDAGLAFFAAEPVLRPMPISMQFNATLIVCGCASAIMLVACAWARELFKRSSTRFWNKMATRRGVQKPPEQELPPRVAAALRKT